VTDAEPCACGEHVVIRPWSTCLHCLIRAEAVATIVAWLRGPEMSGYHVTWYADAIERGDFKKP